MGLRDALIGLPEANPVLSALQDVAPLIIKPLAPLTDNNVFPMANYQFTIEIQGSIVALFQKISGITVSRNIDALTEGGFNEYTYEFPGNFSYNHITFEVGLTANDFFYRWMMVGKHFGGFALGMDFTLIQNFPDPTVDPLKWIFDGAFPVKWKISDLSIDNSKAIVLEKLELSFNYFEPV
jgi:phage tail-like protein